MEIVNIFERSGFDRLIDRVNSLSPESKSKWGKMDVAQVLAHCNLVFEMFYHKERFKKPNPVVKFLSIKLIKPMLLGPKPYKHSMRTAPELVVTEAKNFDQEHRKLLDHLEKTNSLGEAHFEGQESISFGKMTAAEWSTLWSKHLDHHLSQFGN